MGLIIILKIIKNIWDLDDMVDLGFIKRGIEDWDMVNIEIRDGIKKEILINIRICWKQFQRLLNKNIFIYHGWV